MPKLLWPYMENILNYCGEIIHDIFDFSGHVIYWVHSLPREISKETYSYKNVFFPAIQMSSLLETAGQR